MIKIAINGFGRIGRTALRLINKESDMEVVAINDLTDAHQLAYLYKYDSVHGRPNEDVSDDGTNIIVGNKSIKVYSEMDPNNLPWDELGIDVVLECTGVFTSSEKCMSHINAGAKKVIISAPAKDDTKTVVFNVNHNILNSEDKIISCASCTTNCLAPVIGLLNKNFGVKKGYMLTVHAMTNDQETLDIPHKKGIESRRGRAASLNIIPTSSGAASQIGKIIPELNGLLDGNAYRVPVGDGSLLDVSISLNTRVTKEMINNMYKSNQNETIKYTEVPIVSSDIIGDTTGALVDGLLTNVIDTEEDQLVKVVAWYDNEVGYTAQMIRVVRYLSNI